MIYNILCAYCNSEMNNIENDNLCKSVEHMIPKSASILKRTNADGDFYTCRKCNLSKSRMDELLGLTTRLSLESVESKKDVEKFISRIEKNDKLFINTIKSFKSSNEGISFSIPISAKDAIEYFTFFAKGQYLINTGSNYPKNGKLIIVDVFGQSIVNAIVNKYQRKNGSNAFEDLAKNPNEGIYNLASETFIISSPDTRDMFIFFNRALLIKINILPQTRENLTLRNKTRRRLYELWGKNGPQE